jgi:hypothetical protein
MRLILLPFITFVINGCSHSPPIYSPSRMLIAQEPVSQTTALADNKIEVSQLVVTVQGENYQIADRYTSALNHKCVRYYQSDSRQSTTLISVCQTNDQVWLPLERLN